MQHFVLLEALFGLWVGSLALLADAAHKLTDVFGLLIAWSAVVVARRRPTKRHTYGLGRATILAALANGIILLIAVGAIAREAIARIAVPEPIAATTVLWVALTGIAINSTSALLFWKGRLQDINVKGAFLHMAADAAVSTGVVLSASPNHCDGLGDRRSDSGACGGRSSCLVSVWACKIGYPFKLGWGPTRCGPKYD